MFSFWKPLVRPEIVDGFADDPGVTAFVCFLCVLFCFGWADREIATKREDPDQLHLNSLVSTKTFLNSHLKALKNDLSYKFSYSDQFQ